MKEFYRSSQKPLLVVAAAVAVAVTHTILFHSSQPFFFVAAHFDKNESSYLNFHIPTSLRRNESWPHISSMFGRVGGLHGQMALPVKHLPDHSDLCDVPPTFKEIAKQLNLADDGGSPFALLVLRGHCTFVKKVRNAQQLGASAAIIADAESDGLPEFDGYDYYGRGRSSDVILLDYDAFEGDDDGKNETHRSESKLPDDGSGLDVSIPSVMIGKAEYLELKKVLDSKKNSTGVVLAEMAWKTPQFDNQVSMELWYSPIDEHTNTFLTNFSAVARTFDLNGESGDQYNPDLNMLRFKERPVLLDGKALGCVGSTESPDEPCYKLCTNGGRYCHVSHRHTDGRDIVVESLRRLCVDKHYKPPTYWDYVDKFSEFCWDADYFSNEKCVDDVYENAKIDKATIETCMADSGGYDKGSSENQLLQHSLDMQLKWGIHRSPIVTVNHQISGMVYVQGLSPKSVLQELCQTFSYGMKPHVCYACGACGDPVACATRTPMQCMVDDGKEKEDANAHKNGGDSNGGGGGGDDGNHGHFHWLRWTFGLLMIAGCAYGGFVYYKKYREENSGLGSYTLHEAFLSNSEST